VTKIENNSKFKMAAIQDGGAAILSFIYRL